MKFIIWKRNLHLFQINCKTWDKKNISIIFRSLKLFKFLFKVSICLHMFLTELHNVYACPCISSRPRSTLNLTRFRTILHFPRSGFMVMSTRSRTWLTLYPRPKQIWTCYYLVSYCETLNLYKAYIKLCLFFIECLFNIIIKDIALIIEYNLTFLKIIWNYYWHLNIIK